MGRGQFDDEYGRILKECYYLIGYCYFELGLHEKDYRYLDLLANLTHNYEYVSEFINCLIAVRDVRLINYIEI